MRKAQDLIRELELAADNIVCVHYACESWFDVKDRPTGVACISFVDYATRGSTTFSLTDSRLLATDKEAAELEMLRRYYAFLRERPDTRFVHWNMNTSEFGFEAIDNRFSYLVDEPVPYSPPADKVIDLDDLVAHRYGQEFADHPKLNNLATLNAYSRRYMLSGKEEADKYDKGDFGDIKRSTAEKAHLIYYLTKLFLAGSLETKTGGARINFATGNLDAGSVIRSLARRVKLVGRQLTRRHSDRPTIQLRDEYDYQDLFHSLLRVFFDDVRPEDWVPSYAGSANRVDFILPACKIVVELKHARPSLTARQLGEQLVVDIEKYSRHPNVRHVLCLVFDEQGNIPNPRGIESDLTGVKDGVMVTVDILD